MRIFNEDKTVQMYLDEDRVEDGDFIDIPDNLICDLSKGKLVSDTLIEHIPEQQEIQEQWHYRTIKEYPNGGKDVEKVIDVVGQPYIAEHDEVEDILVYKPYSEQELKKLEDEKKLSELINWFDNYFDKQLNQSLWQDDFTVSHDDYFNKDYANIDKLKAQAKIVRNEIRELRK